LKQLRVDIHVELIVSGSFDNLFFDCFLRISQLLLFGIFYFGYRMNIENR